MTTSVDSSIYERAEDTAKADYPNAADSDVRVLAEAFQLAYENWASDMDAKTPHSFVVDDSDAQRVKHGGEDIAHCVICGEAEDRPVHKGQQG